MTIAKSSVAFVALLVASSMMAFPVQADQPQSCSATNDGGGFGGSKVSCGPYHCPTGSTLSVIVEGDDSIGKADVNGNAACADAFATCQGKGSCDSATNPTGRAQTTRSSDSGTCYGESNEVWSSAVSVSCAATGGTPPDPCPVPEWLIECDPDVRVPRVLHLLDPLLEADTPALLKRIGELVDGDAISEIHLFGWADQVLAFSCADLICQQVPVSCFIAESGYHACRA